MLERFAHLYSHIFSRFSSYFTPPYCSVVLYADTQLRTWKERLTWILVKEKCIRVFLTPDEIQLHSVQETCGLCVTETELLDLTR